MSPPDISFIIPVYNGSNTITELYERIAAVCQQVLSVSFETIWVDDYSKDNSWDMLTALQQQYPNTISIIRLSKNFGQHSATLCGMTQAKGNVAITIDDDLQMHPEDIPKLYDAYKTQKCDLVYAIANEEKQQIIRKIARNIFSKIQRWEGKNRGRGSSFRLLSRPLYHKLIDNLHGFVFIDEICLWHTRRIEYVNIAHYPSKRANSQSRYRLASLLNLSMNLIIFSSNLPLRLMTFIGFSASFINLLIILFFIYKKLFKNVAMGYTSIMIAIFFSTSIILFCLGIVGEYLNKVYHIQKRIPLYSIDEIKSSI